MRELVVWLKKQVQEDERIASEATQDRWRVERWHHHHHEFVVLADHGIGAPAFAISSAGNAEHIARWDPETVFAECATKRQIIALYEEQLARAGENAMEEDRAWTLEPVIRLYAADYARLGRAGYLEEWRPDGRP